MKSITIRLPQSDADWLQSAAVAECRSVAGLVTYAVMLHLRTHHRTLSTTAQPPSPPAAPPTTPRSAVVDYDDLFDSDGNLIAED